MRPGQAAHDRRFRSTNHVVARILRVGQVIELDIVRNTVIIGIGVGRSGANLLLLPVGDGIAVGVIVEVVPAIGVGGRVGIRNQWIGVGEVLVQIIQTIAVAVNLAIGIEVAEVGDFPHIGHQIAVVVIGNSHRQLGIGHDDGGIALEDRGMSVIGAPVLEPVVVDGVLDTVPGNHLMVETQVTGKTAGGRQDDRALAVDRGLGARGGPNAHFIDPTFEAGTDGCRYRSRTIACTCVQGDCSGLFSAVDIQAQAFVDRIEHCREMRPDLERYEVIDRGHLQRCHFVDVGETHERQTRSGNTKGVVLRADVAADDDILAGKGGLRIHPCFNCPAAIEGKPTGLRQ